MPGSTFCLGWDTPLERGSSAGTRFSRHSVGHLSYTGCSLWIDLDRRLVVLLLCNRVHPEDGNFTIRHFRPLLHDLVIEAVG